MGVPKDFDALKDGPTAPRCGRCHNIFCKPTRAYRLLQTGIVEQLYICQGCCWGVVVRYDPVKPEQYVACSYVTPGKSWDGIMIRKSLGKNRAEPL